MTSVSHFYEELYYACIVSYYEGELQDFISDAFASKNILLKRVIAKATGKLVDDLDYLGENALSIDIVKSALTYVSGYNGASVRHPQYLNDSQGEATDPDIKTSELVSGYKPLRKKK